MRKIVPFVFFDGNCAEAMNFYKDVFGGDLALLTMADMPGDHSFPDEVKDLVMYSCLTVGDFTLRASDRTPGRQANSGPPTGADLSLDFATVEEAKALFAKLCEGGQALMGPEETFFSPCYGTLKDKFGVGWMVVTDMPS